MQRTGRFGIGVLSYFMLGLEVGIQTRRIQSVDEDGCGWSFTTCGVESFGELRRSEKNTPGTILSLRIREELVNVLTVRAVAIERAV